MLRREKAFLVSGAWHSVSGNQLWKLSPPKRHLALNRKKRREESGGKDRAVDAEEQFIYNSRFANVLLHHTKIVNINCDLVILNSHGRRKRQR